MCIGKAGLAVGCPASVADAHVAHGSEPFIELTRLSSLPEAFRTATEPPEESTAMPALS